MSVELDYAPPAPRPVDWKRRLRTAAWTLLGATVLVGGWILIQSIRDIPTRRVHEDIDRNSGQVRRTRYFLWFTTGRQVTQSPVWQVLPPPASQGEPDWCIVRAWADGLLLGPHWNNRDAIDQIAAMEALWKSGALSNEAKVQVAQKVLRLWQSGDDGFWKADDYLRAVEGTAAKAGTGRMVTAGELPP